MDLVLHSRAFSDQEIKQINYCRLYRTSSWSQGVGHMHRGGHKKLSCTHTQNDPGRRLDTNYFPSNFAGPTACDPNNLWPIPLQPCTLVGTSIIPGTIDGRGLLWIHPLGQHSAPRWNHDTAHHCQRWLRWLDSGSLGHFTSSRPS
jgi:hypothetical protein